MFMKKIFSIVILLFIYSYSLQAAIKIMPLSEIKPGMKGTGKTVFSGTTIEEFEFEVIGIIENFAPQIDIILVRLIGPTVEKAGVISGMSGSPVYIKNKLVGALAYSIGIFQKEPIAGVTPIEQMLEIENKEKFRDNELSVLKMSDNELVNVALTSTSDEQIDFISILTEKITKAQHHLSQLQPLSIPITFSGFNPGLMKTIHPVFEQMGFLVAQGGTNTSINHNSSIKPGDAVAGVLVSGDYSINATGTVTYCEGNKVLAFGHPFFSSGPVNIPMAKVKILTVLPSLLNSYKISSTGEIVGNIRQDRKSGILGIIGEKSPMFPVEVKYISPFEPQRSYHYNITKDQSLNFITPVLFWLTLINILESARFSNGDYSIKLNGKFNLNGDADIVLENFYTSPKFSDPAGSGRDIMAAAYDVVMTLIPLMVNNYKYPDITNVELSFSALPGKKSLNIEKVWYDKTEVLPGGNLTLNIQLREFYGDLITINKTVRIPKNISSSRLIVSIGSASYITKWEKNFSPGKFQHQNFEELIQILNNKRNNNMLYIQIKVFERGALINGKELTNLPPTIFNILNAKKTRGTFKNLREFVLNEYKIPMEYSIFGGKSIQIKIKKHKKTF